MKQNDRKNRNKILEWNRMIEKIGTEQNDKKWNERKTNRKRKHQSEGEIKRKHQKKMK